MRAETGPAMNDGDRTVPDRFPSCAERVTAPRRVRPPRFDKPTRTRSHVPAIAPASRSRAALALTLALACGRSRCEELASWALPLLLACAGCGPEVSLNHGADADVYVRAICEDRCAKYDECIDLVPEGTEDCSVERCVESQMIDFSDPCFAEEDEFFRCRAERLSCEEYTDPNIDTSPGTICYEFLFAFGLCRERHPRP